MLRFKHDYCDRLDRDAEMMRKIAATTGAGSSPSIGRASVVRRAMELGIEKLEKELEKKTADLE